jgi:hypothetical protein
LSKTKRIRETVNIGVLSVKNLFQENSSDVQVTPFGTLELGAKTFGYPKCRFWAIFILYFFSIANYPVFLAES